MATEIFRPAPHVTTLACVQEPEGNSNTRTITKNQRLKCVSQIALTYGARFLVFVINLLFNPYVRELYPSWYAMAWSVLLVAGSAPVSYAIPISNKISGDEAQSFGVDDTIQLSEEIRHNLSVAAYDDNSSFNAARGPGTGIWGVGIDLICRPRDNYALVNTSEFDKVASAVASTIMVLVPALLSFAPLPTASIRTLLYFNIEAALCSAAMTLGLYNKSLSTLSSTAMLTVKDLCDESTISLYGSAREPPAPGGAIPVLGVIPYEEPPAPGVIPALGGTPYEEQPSILYANTPEGGIPTPNGGLRVGEDSDSDKSSTNPVLSELYGLYDISPSKLKALKERVNHKRPDRLVVTLLTIAFTIVQLILFGVIVLALPVIDDIKFVWICEGSSVFIWWVGGAAMLSGIFRTFIVSSFVGKDEVFHLSALPPDILPGKCERCSVDVEPPPTRTPGVRLRDFFTCTFSAIAALPRFLKPDQKSVERFEWASECLKLVYRRSISQHPMVVIVRLTPEDPFPVRHPACFVFLGLLQAMMLIFLSFLFGSIWGGTLFYTLGFVTALMGTIFVSRFCSIFLCRWLERHLGMTVIQCENIIELMAIKKTLAAMPEVLVENKTDSYKYSAGYRLDTKCQNHSEPTTANSKETPSLGVLGLIIGFITGIIEGVMIGLMAYTVLRLTDHRAGQVFSGDYLPPLVIGLSLGICFSVLLFVKIVSEFRSLSGYDIKIKSPPGTVVGSPPSLPSTAVGSPPSPPSTAVGSPPGTPGTAVGSLPSTLGAGAGSPSGIGGGQAV